MTDSETDLRCQCDGYPVLNRTGVLIPGDGVAHGWSQCVPVAAARVPRHADAATPPQNGDTL